MRGYIDGVRRPGASLGPMQPQAAAVAMPRAVSFVPSAINAPRLDGLIQRVAPAPIPAAGATVALPIAQPLAPTTTSWMLPAALAVVTVGVAASSIGLEAGNVRVPNVSALLSRAQPAAAAHAPVAPKPVALTAPAPSLFTIQHALQTTISQQATAAGVPTGIVTIDLKTGATASSNADAVFTSASLYKLFVAMAVYQRIDAGTLHYTDPVSGTGKNVADCLNAMITVSDNTCGEALGSVVGWDSQNNALHAAGFSHTLLRQYDSEQTSAGDVALLLQRLYKGQLLSSASTAAFTGLLKAQQINDRLPVGLPPGVSVAHKTGDLNGLVHDAGIVYAPGGDYIITALSGPWSSTGQAYSWFAGLSDSLYASLSSARSSK